VVLQVVGQIEHLPGDGADGRAHGHADTVRAQPIGVTEQGRGGTAQLDRGQAQGAHCFGLARTRVIALCPGGEQGAVLPAVLADAGRQGSGDQ
jgi:hypothetical protein